MARLYKCFSCDFTSTDVTELSLMPDGETEFCSECYQEGNNG